MSTTLKKQPASFFSSTAIVRHCRFWLGLTSTIDEIHLYWGFHFSGSCRRRTGCWRCYNASNEPFGLAEDQVPSEHWGTGWWNGQADVVSLEGNPTNAGMERVV